MAVCDQCKAPAVVRLQEITRGGPQDRHYCEACSRETLDRILPQFETALRVTSEKVWEVLRGLYEMRLGPTEGKAAFETVLKYWDRTFLCERCSDEGPAILVLRGRRAGFEVSRLCEACAKGRGLAIREVQAEADRK